MCVREKRLWGVLKVRIFMHSVSVGTACRVALLGE